MIPRTYTPRTYFIGQKLIKQMGLYAAARHLRNLGVPLELAIDYLVVKPAQSIALAKAP